MQSYYNTTYLKELRLKHNFTVEYCAKYLKKSIRSYFYLERGIKKQIEIKDIAYLRGLFYDLDLNKLFNTISN